MASSFSSLVVLRRIHMMAALKNSENNGYNLNFNSTQIGSYSNLDNIRESKLLHCLLTGYQYVLFLCADFLLTLLVDFLCNLSEGIQKVR